MFNLQYGHNNPAGPYLFIRWMFSNKALRGLKRRAQVGGKKSGKLWIGGEYRQLGQQTDMIRLCTIRA
jgi:hypothetical protein